MSANNHLNKTIPVVEMAWDEQWHNKYTLQLPPDYHPELDTMLLLINKGSSLYKPHSWDPPVGLRTWVGLILPM
jgi:hypothetical protein